MKKYNQNDKNLVIKHYKSHLNDGEISELTGFGIYFVAKTTRQYWKEKMKYNQFSDNIG